MQVKPELLAHNQTRPGAACLLEKNEDEKEFIHTGNLKF